MSRIVSRPFSTVDCVATHFPVADLNWEMVDALGTWLGAFLTISLLAVTLFQVGLLDWRFGPRLELVWENLEPTFQAIESWEETTPQDMSFQIRGKVVNTSSERRYRISEERPFANRGIRRLSAFGFCSGKVKMDTFSLPTVRFYRPGFFCLVRHCIHATQRSRNH